MNEREKIKINDLYHVVSTNIKYNHVNNIIKNELKFDIGKRLANNPIKDPLYAVRLSLIIDKILYIH